MLDDLNNKTMLHPFVAKELFGEKRTFFLLPTCWELQMASLVHSSVPELAAEAFRSSSNLKGNLIKFLKVDGSSDVQGCSEGAPMVARFKILACANHMCEHVSVYLQQRLHQRTGVISASTCVKLRPNNGFSPSKRNQWTLSSAYWSLITFWMSEHMTAEQRNPLSL